MDAVDPRADQGPVEIASVDEAMALFRTLGGRATQARRLVIGALLEADRPLRVDELVELVQVSSPYLNKSTVYRNLEELENVGLIVHTHVGHGASTYQLASRRRGVMVCEACGVTLELPRAQFESLQREALESAGFTIDPGHSAILGLCHVCSSA